MSTLNQKSNKVGCDGPDGLLRVHPENETCDVCGSAVSDEDESAIMVNRGALKLAENVLRRAGKSEVADALIESACCMDMLAAAPTGEVE